MTPHPSTSDGRRARTACLAAVTVLLLPACGQEEPAPGASPGAQDAFGHVHGLAVDPGTGDLVLAGHRGLFDLSGEQPEKIGASNDLMGFAVAGPGHYYASGHPGAGSELPDPVGLMESTDGGETWQVLSRQGESDFHAVAASAQGVVGFDGTLRLTADGEQWTDAAEQIQPAHLAASAQGPVVLATTRDGVRRSTDGGRTWEPPADAPVLLVTGFADAGTVVGADQDGAVRVSRDAGVSWEPTGGRAGPPAAVAADLVDGDLHVWVATEEGVEFSADGGASFSTAVPAAGH